MRLNFKTPAQRMAILCILLFITSIILIFYHHFILGAFGIALLIIFSIMVQKLVSEDLVVFFLKQNSGKADIEILHQKFSKNVNKIVNRLKRKGIVASDERVVILLEKTRLNTFEELRKR